MAKTWMEINLLTEAERADLAVAPDLTVDEAWALVGAAPLRGKLRLAARADMYPVVLNELAASIDDRVAAAVAANAACPAETLVKLASHPSGQVRAAARLTARARLDFAHTWDLHPASVPADEAQRTAVALKRSRAR